MEVNKCGFENNSLLTLFEEKHNEMDVRFGTVTIPPGERVPKKGLSKHEENEYAIIVKGEIEGESGGTPFKVLESHATFIPAGEQHWSINSGEEPCKIVWVLVKEN
ncbi:cupin domain-containing protein [Lentibacillus cibarius]|uniref:Cupin domain-containing protein n=1 Tax=Lentibacillus cibarius TaxID=2583219 RepID=A0A549YEL9_9BACI|nr:cupin domain-containing protein [Lentibacillus cibarius]TMN21453.1 cupin domain-containing protein [Lentibacillus cibarius]TRM10331.1 cupin domain-containing protein [Lentibacillus cibarius]